MNRTAYLLAVLVGSSTTSGFVQELRAQASQQNDHTDAAVALRVGSLGLGLEISKLLSDHIGARISGNYFSLSRSGSRKNIDYDYDVKFQAFAGLIDLYPGARSSFHITGGVMTDPLKLGLTGKPTGTGTYDLNGTTYSSAQVGTLTGEIRFPSAGPYVGIGFGTPARNGGAIKFFFDLGAMVGHPTVSLTATGATPGSQLARDLQAQVASTQTDAEKLKVYPVISLGLAYSF